MDLLVEHLQAFVEQYGHARRYWLAYSGGVDSHVLLHGLARVQPSNLQAIYINHGISPQSQQWAMHCAKVCLGLSVPFSEHKLNGLNDTSSSLEEQLRDQRYQIFQTLMAEDDILLTAHQQNDQAETVLLQLCRGAGPQGLAAMPPIKRFACGWHARPFLEFTREQIEAYAKAHQLHWVEDESNANPQFTRNFLRHEIMPRLTARWPTLTKTLARTAENCASAQQFIDLTTNDLLTHLHGSRPNTLSVQKILSLKPLEQTQALRAWMMQGNFLLPSAVKMQQILRDMLGARSDKMPVLHWKNAEMRRYRDDLFLSPPLPPHDPSQIIPWNVSEPLSLKNIGALQAEGLGNVTVQFRQGGEMVQLAGRNHRHELKKMFQQWGVLPWLRDRVPLIYEGDRLVAVVGFWVAEEVKGFGSLLCRGGPMCPPGL